ncbi:leucine--tRNA ligase [bacterium]|nr:MAG: leucine--tRNA ligase [bacterium]
MADRYDPSSFEAKWREKWAEADLFRTREREGAPKFYGMDFFPYPSGAGLSVGHCRNYVPTDVLCRMKAMQGYNVLHPMGFDAFGLPAENEAIKNKTHPAPMIERYAARYKEQMDLIGVSYDWSRSFSSSDPSYYRWTQWIFELLYKRGLAYQKEVAVNWDPVDKTVLADEEVVNGRGERSGALVEKKLIPQWLFKITAYGDRLIDDLDDIQWPEGIKNQQRNWIGRSYGVEFEINVADDNSRSQTSADNDSEQSFAVVSDGRQPKLSFRVFTTRIDTVFGMTFCVLSPEHPLVDNLPGSEEEKARVMAYQEQARTISEVDRTNAEREKTGVFTGAYAINPANGKKVPIWIADYVLATYGTGAIMAVPGHDERDYEFAQKFGIEVIPVITPEVGIEPALPFVSKDGYLLNSGEYDGLTVAEAQASLGRWVEALGIGERKTQFKLRDWLISRQRYWGCPIPIIHSKEGEQQLVPESALPVELPMVDHYEPSGDGSSPLAHIPEFVNTTDLDGRLGRRETDTMGGFACSSWYFLRFTDPHNDQQAWNRKAADYWMPVDCYVGGAEHAVMHLLYARFWTKVLYDAGLVGVKEPFSRLENQGQVLAWTPYLQAEEGKDEVYVPFGEVQNYKPEELSWRWARMSKSRKNVVTPDEMVESNGADALRLYLLFKAPFNADIEWENKGVEDLGKFLSRVFRLAETLKGHFAPEWKDLIAFEEPDDAAKKIRRATHQTIRNVTDDIEKFGFNTYVSWLMKYVNSLNELLPKGEVSRAQALALSEAIETLVLLLSPGAPHSADELWSDLGKEGFTYDAEWPKSDPALAAEDEVTVALQVNGKLRDTFTVPASASKEELETAAMARPKLAPYIEGTTIRKVIVVPGKLVNVVVG